MQSRITLQPHHTLVLGHKEKVGLISSLKNNYRLLQKYEVNAGLA